MTKISNLYGLTNYITANTSGNVVIEAPTSGTALYVTGSAQVTGQLTLGSTITNGTYTYTLPSATGTLALASSLGSYLPLAGGTLTGPLNGTSGTFTGNVSTSAQLRIESSGNAILVIGSRSAGTLFEVYNSSNILRFYNGSVEALKITTGAGDATFASSVTAGGTGDGDWFTLNRSTVKKFNINLTSDWTTITSTANRLQLNDYTGGGISINGGNVGIGTTSPSTGYIGGNGSLTLQNAKSIAFQNYSNGWNTTTTGGAITYFTDNNLYIDAKDSASNMIFRVNGDTERMRITSAGNVGIGTTSPTGLLHIAGADPAFRIQSTTTGNMQMGQWDGTYNRIQGSGRDFILINTDATNMLFSTNSTERMRITSGGNVLIGTTTDSGYPLIVAKARDGWQTAFVNTSSYGTTNVFFGHGEGYGAYIDSGSAGASSARYILKAVSGGSERFVVRGDGLIFAPGIYNNTNSNAANVWVNSDGSMYRSTSSIKYKKNVQNYSKGLAEILQMRPVIYEGKCTIDEGKIFAGLIAEEIHDLGLTEFVQYAEDGTPDALAYSNMVSLLIKGMQELKAELDTLKNK